MTEKHRVAVYARVSTEEEGQKNSQENQKSYFLQMIREHPNWELYRIYADEGVSGTVLGKRPAFLQMLQDARERRFDLILTKEVSRFARNTVDTLSVTRELRQNGVRILFVGDGIDTFSGDGEFRLAIMASVAQEESRKISERVRFGIYRQMEQGFVFARSVYGYHLENGVLTLNETEAQVVRRIFSMAANGYNCAQIARILCTDSAPKGKYIKEWKGHTVRKILRNEKYCGDLKQRKTAVVDYLTHKSRENKGEYPFIILRNHHSPIVGRNLWRRANENTARKSQTDTLTGP